MKTEEKLAEDTEPKQKPRFNFGGLKKQMIDQNEENKEANKGLEEYQEKLKEQIKIHEPKRPREDRKKREEEPEFEEVVDEKKREGGAGRGRGRGRGDRGTGFRGGRGGHNEERPATSH